MNGYTNYGRWNDTWWERVNTSQQYPEWKKDTHTMWPDIYGTRKDGSLLTESKSLVTKHGRFCLQEGAEVMAIFPIFGGGGWWKCSNSWLWWCFGTLYRFVTVHHSVHSKWVPFTVYRIYYNKMHIDYSKSTKGNAHGNCQPVCYFFWKFCELCIFGIRIG